MRRFFAAAIEELSAADPGALLVFTAAARPLPIERLIAADPSGEPIVLWDDPSAEPDGRAWSFAGWGEAARLDATGATRLDQIRRAADALFAGLAERRDPGASDVPSPRLFGGVAFVFSVGPSGLLRAGLSAEAPPAQAGVDSASAFRALGVQAAPWSAFGDASFTLPRWLYGRSGDRAFLRLSARAGSDRAAIAASMDAALRRLARAAEAPLAAPRRAEARLDRTSPAAWCAMIEDALARIRVNEMEKVVPTTICRVSSAAPLDPAQAIGRMRAAYPECARFAFQRGAATFLGASPERLVGKRGLAAHADALAGSAARRSGADDLAVRDLLASDKDRREHRVVVDAITLALAPFSREVRAPSGPAARTLRNVHHLWTPIAATLARPAHVLDLVRALHPTPAVCGTPREAAIAWIAAHEPVPRGWYAGAVGWFDGAGDGAFSVAIRSGVLDGHDAWLYAGAGIVEGSDASAEYAETRVKLAPMLAALGIGAEPPLREAAQQEIAS